MGVVLQRKGRIWISRKRGHCRRPQWRPTGGTFAEYLNNKRGGLRWWLMIGGIIGTRRAESRGSCWAAPPLTGPGIPGSAPPWTLAKELAPEGIGWGWLLHILHRDGLIPSPGIVESWPLKAMAELAMPITWGGGLSGLNLPAQQTPRPITWTLGWPTLTSTPSVTGWSVRRLWSYEW